MTKLTHEQRVKLAGKWEDLNPATRCVVLRAVSELLSHGGLIDWGKVLSEFEINNGLAARVWLELKYENTVLEMTQK